MAFHQIQMIFNLLESEIVNTNAYLLSFQQLPSWRELQKIILFE